MIGLLDLLMNHKAGIFAPEKLVFCLGSELFYDIFGEDLFHQDYFSDHENQKFECTHQDENVPVN